MNKGLRDRDYLRHIEAAVCKIQRFLKNKDESHFMEDERLEDGVVRNLEIIGEAVPHSNDGGPESSLETEACLVDR